MADLITSLVSADVHQLTAADPYSSNYMSTVARNVEEQARNARPGWAKHHPT